MVSDSDEFTFCTFHGASNNLGYAKKLMFKKNVIVSRISMNTACPGARLYVYTLVR
jgi:hypothetical protein